MTRSAPAPLSTLSDAESAKGQKKSPPEFLVAKVNALESSFVTRETELFRRLFARHPRVCVFQALPSSSHSSSLAKIEMFFKPFVLGGFNEF